MCELSCSSSGAILLLQIVHPSLKVSTRIATTDPPHLFELEYLLLVPLYHGRRHAETQESHHQEGTDRGR
jgi:hypothetical protein